jgi:cytochrome c-type biogenesis protein CcmH
MLFWIALAALTAAVTAALLRPLAAPESRTQAPAEADISVYKDQLKEIDADSERGLIGDEEANAARAEVGRRLLVRADLNTDPSASAPNPQQKSALLTRVRTAVALVVPLLALGFYLQTGSPGLPGRPYAPPGGKPVELASREELVAMVEKRLREVPNDGKGWDVIAPVYFSLGRFADAQTAYDNAIRILGENPKRLKGVAEAAIILNNGLVTEEARRAFERLLELEPDNGEAKFGLALALEQDGKLAEAAESYRAILAAAPSDAPWRPSLEVRLARLMRGGGAPQPDAPSPSGTSKEEQDKFILGMVERLAARLKKAGRDLAGWQQLVRSYKVLGRDADAEKALEDARRNFEGDEKSLSTLNEFAASLGLKS